MFQYQSRIQVHSWRYYDNFGRMYHSFQFHTLNMLCDYVSGSVLGAVAIRWRWESLPLRECISRASLRETIALLFSRCFIPDNLSYWLTVFIQTTTIHSLVILSSSLPLNLMSLDSQSKIPFLEDMLSAIISAIKTLSGHSTGNRTNSRHSMWKEQLNIGNHALIKSLERWNIGLKTAPPEMISDKVQNWSARLLLILIRSERWGMGSMALEHHLGSNTLSCSYDTEIRNLGSGSHCNPAATASQSYGIGSWDLKSGFCLCQNYISTLAKIKTGN